MPEEALPLLAVLANSPDPVFVTDRHNHIVFWNDAVRLLLGFTADEAIGGDDHVLHLTVRVE